MLENLKNEVTGIGKPEWGPMLGYVAHLHGQSTHPAGHPFPYPWEEIGPGYCYRPAFGHWDIVHQILDVLPAEMEHARNQILNDLANQSDDGLVPGSIVQRGDEWRWSRDSGHPPMWPVAAHDYFDLTQDQGFLLKCLESLESQIGWFEAHRKAEDAGYFYLDIVSRRWESGVDEGVRFDNTQPGRYPCVDATSHVDMLYQYASAWSSLLGRDPEPFEDTHHRLASFIHGMLFDPETGFFHDVWAVGNPAQRRLTFEGMWPVVTGSATPEQAARVIDENLLNPDRFFSPHPIATVAVSDPAFELRMWRGPVWNSMTYWAARGCLRYGRADAAGQILERALDASAKQFDRTGTIWEFYHPLGGDPEAIKRKPQTAFNTPCRDYLGHNPLIAMARMWQVCEASAHSL